ncbi:hypothetical protein BKA70DRAFT_1115654 [Coprinopsis sp. MPI-PUGE-AT-0042]|nr:hypothetical protein BKA70DRAFT_1115654 [Coprinopsis sp. MPI-PUGE-AT-0042]
MEPEISGGKRRLSEVAECSGEQEEGELEEGELGEEEEAVCGEASDKKSRKSLYRKKRKDARILAAGLHAQAARVQQQAQEQFAVSVPANLSSLPSSSCGYRAYVKPSKPLSKPLQLDSLLKDGYKLIEWDGKTTRPIVDPDTSKTFMVLVAPPDDPTYRAACDEVASVLEAHAQSGSFTNEELSHKRGQFPALNVGTSYGQGSTRPSNLRNKDAAMVASLLANTCIQRVAIFASYALSMWFPGFYHYAKVRLDSLYQRMPELSRNFDRSVYPRAAFNLGSSLCTLPHLDLMNCPFGLCSIQAFGTFNHKRSGHLILPDLKLIIEFPSGSLILMPSATLQHANTPVLAGERRSSFTQYCPGGLFRFVDNDFKTKAALKTANPALYKKNMELKKQRWEMGLSLWNTLGELVQRASGSGEKNT